MPHNNWQSRFVQLRTFEAKQNPNEYPMRTQQVHLSCTIFCNGDLGNGTIRANHLLFGLFLDRKEKIRRLLRWKFQQYLIPGQFIFDLISHLLLALHYGKVNVARDRAGRFALRQTLVVEFSLHHLAILLC